MASQRISKTFYQELPRLEKSTIKKFTKARQLIRTLDRARCQNFIFEHNQLRKIFFG